MKQVSWWKHSKMKRITPKPQLKLPKSKNFVKSGVHLALGLTALGVGLAAYEAVSGGD